MSNSKVVKAGIGYTIGNYFIKGLTFLTLPIFTRLMNPSDYGIYNIFIASEGFLYVLIGLAIHTTYKNAWYKYGDIRQNGISYNSYVSSTMVLILISAFVWFLLFLIFAGYLSNLLLLDRICLIILVAYSASMAVMACFNVHIGIQYRFKTFVLVSGLNAICNISVSILLMLTIFSDQRYLGRIIGTSLPAVIIGFFIIYFFIKKSKPSSDLSGIKWGLKYSLPIVPNGIGQVIIGQFDRMMINKMISSFSAGIYSFAYNIFGVVNVTYMSLDNVWSPWLYEKMNKKDYSLIRSKANVYVTLLFLFSSIIIMISPELIHLMGTPDYYESSYSVIPIIAGGFFLFLSSLPISIEYFYERTKMIATATLLAAIMKVLLNMYCLREYGYISAGYTTLVTYIFYFLFHYITARKIHGKDIFFTFGIIQYSIGILLITAVAVSLINSFPIRWIIACGISCFFYFYEEHNFGLVKKLLNK